MNWLNLNQRKKKTRGEDRNSVMSLISQNTTQTITNAKDLEDVLLQLVVPNSTVIQNAEKVLKQFTQQQHCLGAFIQQIQSSAHLSVRQAAAVLMRAKIKSHWEGLDHGAREFIKKSLLECLVKEIEYVVFVFLPSECLR